MVRKLSFLVTLVLLFLTSCKKDEECICDITYDIQLPTEVLKIADAYAEYNDNGITHSELMHNGKFEKNFHYKWDDQEANSTHTGFNTLKVILRPKVSNSRFQEGAKLLKDGNAFFIGKGVMQFSQDKNNYWTGSSSSSSLTSSTGGNYVWGKDIQNHAYTVEEQIAWFNSQESNPLIYFKFDHIGNQISCTVRTNVGQNDDNDDEIDKTK